MTAQGQNKRGLSLGAIFRCCLLLATFTILLSSYSWGADANVMTSLDVVTSGDATVVKITSDNPVGYRYTVYDSIDPVRVVIDFPGMDVDSVLSINDVAKLPVERLRFRLSI